MGHLKRGIKVGQIIFSLSLLLSLLSGCVFVPPGPLQSVTAAISSSEGGSIEFGGVKLSFPAHALPYDVLVTLSFAQEFSKPASPQAALLITPVQVNIRPLHERIPAEAEGAHTSRVTEVFASANSLIEVTISYADVPLGKIREETIAIYTEAKSGAERVFSYLGGEIDRARKIIVAALDLSEHLEPIIGLIAYLDNNCRAWPLGFLQYELDLHAETTVVLVHGITSQPDTWTAFINKLKSDSASGVIPAINILSFWYCTAESVLKSGELLDEKLREHVTIFSSKKLFLVAHSMGGLVAKAAIYSAQQSGGHWLEKLEKVVLIGTPNDGSPVADWVFASGNRSKWLGIALLPWLFNSQAVGLVGGLISFLALAPTTDAVKDLTIGSEAQHRLSADSIYQAADFYAIAGTDPSKPQSGFLTQFLLWISSKAFPEGIIHDGLVSETSARGAIYGPFISSNSANYKDFALNHFALRESDEVYTTIRSWLLPVNNPPTASITSPPDGSTFFIGQTVHFDGSNSYDPDGYIKCYTWDFGDGNVQKRCDPAGATWAYAYDKPGTYIVTLTVEDDAGAIGTDSIKITVTKQGECTVTLSTGNSIQAAINDAAPGDVICLTSGTWYEHLMISKNLTLRGAGFEQTTIETTMPFNPAILITSTSPIQVNIEGLTATTTTEITNPSTGITVNGSSIANISNVQISQAYPGLLIRDSAQVLLTNAHIVNNPGVGISCGDWSRLNLTNIRLSDNGMGIVAWGSATINGANIQIFNNGIGLTVEDSATLTLTSTQISNSRIGAQAVSYQAVGESFFTLSDSQIEESSDFGFLIRGNPIITLIRTAISSSGWGGIFIEAISSAQLEIRQSTIENNGTNPDCQQAEHICNGIQIVDQAQLTVTDSIIRYNTDWGIAAVLQKCGYAIDNFIGQVIFQGENEIYGNNTAGNHEGEVCLPELYPLSRKF